MPIYEHNKNRNMAVKRITHKLYALYKCLYHWEFMYATGTGHKSMFWKCREFRQVKYYYIPVSECYVCTNMLSNAASKELAYSTRGCMLCTLTGFAWKKECIERYSIYRGWLDSRNKADRSLYAQRMVDVIKEAIKHHEMKRLRHYNG